MATQVKKGIDDAEVEREIAELLENEDVLLAKTEARIRNRRRQYLYQLRWMERRGKELREQGYTLESLALVDSIGKEGESYGLA